MATYGFQGRGIGWTLNDDYESAKANARKAANEYGYSILLWKMEERVYPEAFQHFGLTESNG